MKISLIDSGTNPKKCTNRDDLTIFFLRFPFLWLFRRHSFDGPNHNRSEQAGGQVVNLLIPVVPRREGETPRGARLAPPKLER